jgi:hypothetical protein
VTRHVILAALITAACLSAQEEQTPAPVVKPAAPKTAREEAPIDLTGYWAAVVT